MTYQKLTHDDDNVDEASSLLTIVTVSPAPSFSLSQNGVASKKNGAPMMRAVIATTCFLLGTLAVLFSGGSGSSSSNTASSGVLSVALLLGQNQAASVYDPSHDWCFKDNDNDGKYCWFPTHNYPCGNWGGWDAAYDNCGPKCTTVYWYEDKYSCDYLHRDNRNLSSI